ncbi:MAG: hypothetical protein F6K14_19335 [Symploca sp. SIO2C1]|nr:hypothetical protein [Symploca sp. SIO2C1]
MVEPISTIALITAAAPVVAPVCEVLCKVIDNIWTQPQANRFHREEQNAQHQLRLEELKKQHEYSIIKSFSDSRIKINEQQIIEHLRASYSVWTNKALRNLAREDANSPFFDGVDTTYQTLKALYEQTKLPIILVSPFWDDTKAGELNAQSGYVNFRNAFNASYREVSWSNLASKQDGYFKRPLFQTDRDVNYIYSLLSDLPIILVHGTIQGVHAPHQYVQRIHPHITFWNLFPEKNDSYTNLDLRFFPLQLPIGKDNSPDIYQQMGEYSLDLQDRVGSYLVKAIGLLSSFYHLYHFDTRPNFQQFQLESKQESEFLSLQASDLYDFLSQRSPCQANYYNFQKDLLSLECEIDELSRQKHFPQCLFANQLLQIAATIGQFEQEVTDWSLD